MYLRDEVSSIHTHSEFNVQLVKQAGGLRDRIRATLSHRKSSGIVIQQDGATPHTGCAFVDIINEYIFLVMKSAAGSIKGDGSNIYLY